MAFSVPPPAIPHLAALCLLSLPVCQAQLRWEISLGSFTPDCVLIASSPASPSTSELVTGSPCHITLPLSQ